ncbi:response regulator, partial [bacterium]|nr:response regulator [bacterium]
MTDSSPQRAILVADDEPEALQSLDITLRAAGLGPVRTLSDSRDILPTLRREDASTILLDLNMPYISGEELLPTLRETFPAVPIIIVTAVNEVETAVRCMRQQPFDYLVKPIEPTKLLTTVRRALEFNDLRVENERLKQKMLSDRMERPDAFADIITRNAEMLRMFRYIDAVAESGEAVLISGETGVGKELVAR